MFKKLKYIKPIIDVLKFTTNWFDVVKLYFIQQDTILNLKNGLSLKVNNFHNLVPIKEIFIDREYYVADIKPKIIIDIGANVGDSTIFFSRLYPKSDIYAYEPSKKIYSLLKYNLERNNIKNVNYFNLGISSKVGKVSFYENNKSGLSSQYIKSEINRKVSINTTTLKHVFHKNKIQKCDLLKVDCEGAEYNIILNLDKETLSKIKTIVVEYHEGISKFGRKDLINFLNKNKYKTIYKKHEIESNIGIIYAKK